MPEIKHSFTAGKMNKDVDARLVPNGEYRDAMNIQIRTTDSGGGTSGEGNAGMVQNIQGNISVGSAYSFTNASVSSSIIGYVSQQEGEDADATTADGLVSVLDGADGKYVQLDKATGHKGDYIKIVCDGADWFVIGGIGEFSHEA